jgi:hypothetical protein
MQGPPDGLSFRRTDGRNAAIPSDSFLEVLILPSLQAHCCTISDTFYSHVMAISLLKVPFFRTLPAVLAIAFVLLPNEKDGRGRTIPAATWVYAAALS